MDYNVVMPGQVRVYNVHIQSKLTRAQVPAFAGSLSGTGKYGRGSKGGGGGGGPPALAGTREYEQSDRNR